ncbi:hypothetical protein AAEO56_03840 [Flavobacterium sp. DGU11]|uniref:Uncharacterized protein n=1 Tax=Flavobacterium arundinis TaxID=3139143 RepID=A0ABU9HUY5_9FLAO
MKKLFLSLGAMLAFGIASAQVNNQTGIQNTSVNSQIRTTTKQDEALTKPKPVTTSTESTNTFSNQAPSTVPVTPSMSSPATTTGTTNGTITGTTNNMSRPSTTSGTAPGTSGQGTITTNTTITQ